MILAVIGLTACRNVEAEKLTENVAEIRKALPAFEPLFDSGSRTTKIRIHFGKETEAEEKIREKKEKKADTRLKKETASKAPAESETEETAINMQTMPSDMPAVSAAPFTASTPAATAAPVSVPEEIRPVETQILETAPAETEHVHDWQPVTETIHHAAETEMVRIIDSEAWDEIVEDKAEIEHEVCKGCGIYLESLSEDEMILHAKAHMEAGEEGGFYTEKETVITGTHTVFHEALWHDEVRTVREAYDETVTTGFCCSSCGEKK